MWSIPRAWRARDLVRVPGLLSLGRLGLAAVFPFTVGYGAWPIVVVALSGLSDVLDGWYARRFHEETATGAVVDAFADKVFVITVAVTLLATRLLSAGELLLFGVRDIGEVVLGVRLAAGRRPLLGRAPSRASKIATLAQYLAVLAVLGGCGHHRLLISVAASAGALGALSYWSCASTESSRRR
jgi:phosphatidylglycerophosphate synthase